MDESTKLNLNLNENGELVFSDDMTSGEHSFEVFFLFDGMENDEESSVGFSIDYEKD